MSKIIGLTLWPIMVPGAYYAGNTIVESQKVLDNKKQLDALELEVQLLNCAAPLDNYMNGVYGGIAPFINIAKIADTTSVGVNLKDMKADEKVGFFSGLSIYANCFVLMRLLKHVK